MTNTKQLTRDAFPALVFGCFLSIVLSIALFIPLFANLFPDATVLGGIGWEAGIPVGILVGMTAGSILAVYFIRSIAKEAPSWKPLIMQALFGAMCMIVAMTISRSELTHLLMLAIVPITTAWRR